MSAKVGRMGNLKGFVSLVLMSLPALAFACGGGEEGEELFFQAGQGEIHVSGDRKVDANLTEVTGPNAALYRPKGGVPPHLVIALHSADGRARLSGFLWEIRAPGKYYIVNE